MAKTGLTVTGFAVCPVGRLRGDADGDEMRSNQLSDGRIFNIFTGYSHPIPDGCRNIFSQPQGIRNLVAALISSQSIHDETFRLTHVGNQLDGRDLSEVNAGLVANNVDASVLDITTVALNAGTCLQSLRLTYDGSVEAALATANGADAESQTDNLDAPPVIVTAAKKLLAAGFTPTGKNVEGASLRTITYRKGDGFHPIRAELTWIV